MKSSTLFIGVLLLFILSFDPYGSKAQDLHFSQFQMTPLHLNPAEAGSFNGDHRAFANYKSQWQSLGNGYQSFDLSYDTQILGEDWDKSSLGMGAIVYGDQAGALNFGTTTAKAMLSYHTLLSDKSMISAGIGGGYIQQSVDKGKMEWASQYNGTTHDPSIPVTEENRIGSSGYMDLQSGIRFSYFSKPDPEYAGEGWRMDIGLSGYHLHEPEQELISGENRSGRRINRKFMGYIDSRIALGEGLALRPGVLYSRQGPSQELLGSLMFRYALQQGSVHTGLVEGAALSLGAQYRAGDAIAPAFLIEKGPYQLGISYDVNVGRLSGATNGQGGLELSFRFMNPNPFQRQQSSTPSFL